MNIQLSLVVVIAVLMAYIYWNKDGENGGNGDLLGASTSEVENWKHKWRTAYPGKGYPHKTSRLGEWYRALEKYWKVHGMYKYPPVDLDLIETWERDYDRQQLEWRAEWNRYNNKVQTPMGRKYIYPTTYADFKKWRTALARYKEKMGKGPERGWIGLVAWYDLLLQSENEARESAAAEAKAKDVCEWVERNKDKYMR